MSSIEQYRAGFEAWARDEEFDLARTESGNYADNETQSAWDAVCWAKREASTEPHRDPHALSEMDIALLYPESGAEPECEASTEPSAKPVAHLARHKLLVGEWSDWEVTTEDAYRIRSLNPRADVEVIAVCRAGALTDDAKDAAPQPIVVNPQAPGDLKLGDYVFASRWSDCDPGDPWHVGHVSEIGIGFVVVGEVSQRRWPRAMRITAEQGKRITENYPAMEKNYVALDYEAIARVFGAHTRAGRGN